MRKSSLLLIASLLGLTACTGMPPTPAPDYRIKVTSAPDGTSVAVPPACPSWNDKLRNPLDNAPDPQFGCATARNLAIMVERPEDLVRGREMGPADATRTAAAMKSYENSQTRGLINTGTEKSSIAVTTAPSASAPTTP